MDTFSNELQDFLNEIADFKNEYPNRSLWFRGQTDDWALHSGLFRPKKIRENLKTLKRKEETVYRLFMSEGHPYLKGENDWELLFIMQHHGLKTRLLDWTPSLMTALYFATINSVNPVLWMLRPSKLNLMSIERDSLKSLPMYPSYEDLIFKQEEPFVTLAIQPIRNSARQIIQQGMFTVQGDSNVPLEEEWDGKIVENGYLKKITFSLGLVEEVKYLLKLNNVSHATVYPDLDGLSADINRRFFGVEK